MTKNSYVLWRGPSPLDGAPIMATVTLRSNNRKTGNMAQIQIIRADMSPLDALKTGEDRSICGDCVFRGDGTGKGRACYVTLAHGPQAIWKTTKYEINDPDDVTAILFGADVRFGSYGDPAMLPIDLIEQIADDAAMWTGYTHQWRNLGPRWRAVMMASVDSEEEALEAQSLGWRTYRAGEGALPSEIVCPNETRGVQCVACGLCDGAGPKRARVKSIVILPHGNGAKYMAGV